ncbi:hypothetical protein MJO29_005272 [Puccinia striiformis f. sp. tritici]|nr:hypothetical protein MJO29_005272 [Puccinia striiformis f. sp. tritici]
MYCDKINYSSDLPKIPQVARSKGMEERFDSTPLANWPGDLKQIGKPYYSHTEKACPIAHTGTIQPIAQSGTKLHRQLIGSKSIVIRQDSVSGVKFSAFSCQSAVMHQPGDEFDLNELVPPLPFPDEPRNFHEPQVDNSLATHNPQGYQSFYAGGSFSGQYPSYTTYYQAPGAPYPTGSLLSPTHSVVPNYQNTSNSGMTVYNGSPNYHGSPGGPLPLAYLPSYNGSPARPQPQLNLGSPQPPLAHPAIPSSHRPPGTGTTPAVCPQSLQVTAKGASRKSLNSSGPSSSLVSPLPVILDYLVYTKSKAFMLAEAKSTSPITVTSHKDWVKMEPESVITWDIVLGDLPWAEVQEQVIQKLDQSRPLLGSHIRSLARSELISWQCILINDTVYGVNRKALVSTAQGFTEFCAAVRQHPTWQSKLKIIMPHPAARAKQVQVVQEGNDNLTMSYGAEDNRLKLGLLQARLDLNPKADTSASLLGPLIERITAHIMEKYGSTTESMRIKDPAKPTWSFRIHGGCLWAWARALHHKAPNVDIDNPPKDPGMFISEPEQVYTRAEKAIRDTTSGQAVKHGGKAKAEDVTQPQDLIPSLHPAPSSLHLACLSQGESCRRDSRRRLGSQPPVQPDQPAEVRSRALSPLLKRMSLRAPPLNRSRSEPTNQLVRWPGRQAQPVLISNLYHGPAPPILQTGRPPRRSPEALASASLTQSADSNSISDADRLRQYHRNASVAPLKRLRRLSLTLKQFLDHCNFAKEDHIPRGLIQITQVHHWDFFYREASVADLLYLGYPFPVATQLLRGAQWLATTHVELPNDDTPDEV